MAPFPHLPTNALAGFVCDSRPLLSQQGCFPTSQPSVGPAGTARTSCCPQGLAPHPWVSQELCRQGRAAEGEPGSGTNTNPVALLAP